MDRPKCGEPVPSRNVPAIRTSYLRVIQGGVLPPSAAEMIPGEVTTVRQANPTFDAAEEPTSQVRAAPGASEMPHSEEGTAGRYSQRAPAHAVTVVSGLARQPSAAPPRPSWPPAAPLSHAAQNDNALEADRHFCVAELLFARGHVSDAVLEAQKAMRLREPRPDQRALYAWLLYKRSGSISPSVCDHLMRALAEDPACERALHYRSLIQNPQR
jgi:hypothetical protein